MPEQAVEVRRRAAADVAPGRRRQADDEHAVWIAGEVAFQPERAFEIEIVGRLVLRTPLASIKGAATGQYGSFTAANSSALATVSSRPIAAAIVSATVRTRENMERGSCHPDAPEIGRFLRVIPGDGRFRARMATFILSNS